MNGQAQISMRINESTDNTDLQRLYRFEDIGTEKFTFKGKDLKGKNYKLISKEFENGGLINTSTIFNSSEDEYFRIKNDSLQFHVFTKIEENNFKIQFQFNGFSSTKKFPIQPLLKDDYVLKDFLGAERHVNINLNDPHYILTYMTPYVREDGSSTYCEVAQSETLPEELGKKYAIPHYFLIEITFY